MITLQFHYCCCLLIFVNVIVIANAVQVGSLVPAESAELHVVDAVHTRMGASDNLAMGSSTFLEVWPPPHPPTPTRLCRLVCTQQWQQYV